jgi:hypothetical protein
LNKLNAKNLQAQ